jgi:hypothetical protein
MGHFFHEKSFYRLLEIIFSAQISVQICQLKIQKHGVRQAEYQVYARSTFGSVNFTCNGQHACDVNQKWRKAITFWNAIFPTE